VQYVSTVTTIFASVAVATALAAAATSAHADPSASFEPSPFPGASGTDGGKLHLAQDIPIPTLRRSLTGGLGMELGPFGVANTGHARFAYRAYGPLMVGALVQGTLVASSVEGCSTFDCTRRFVDAHIVAEAHAFADGPFDLWAGLQVGPSVYSKALLGVEQSRVLFSLQADVGADLRLSLAEVRPIVGIAIGLGGYQGNADANGWALSAAWHAGVEF
jgi:hypothetical protein